MKIVVACTGGMSTDILVDRMKKEAESRNIACDIQAIHRNKIEEVLSSNNIDLLLLSPQLMGEFERIKAFAPGETKVEMLNNGSINIRYLPNHWQENLLMDYNKN